MRTALYALKQGLTYANVTATLALLIALGGTSYAAVKITGHDVRNGTLTGHDIRNGSLGMRELNAWTRARILRPRPVASITGQPGPEGPQGPRGPQGVPGPPGAAAPAADPQETVRWGTYEYGAQGLTHRPRLEVFVGGMGEPGEMGVRSWHPNGQPTNGAMLYARDFEDRYNLALDYRRADQPTLLSESPHPLRIQSWAGRVEVDGTLTLRDLDVLPDDAPVGTLAMVQGALHVLTGDGWVQP